MQEFPRYARIIGEKSGVYLNSEFPLGKNSMETRTFMVTRNNVYTPLSESSQCIKICIWFPRRVFKDMVLFSALHSLSKSIQT